MNEKLITTFCIYKEWKEDSIQRQIDALLDQIKTFCFSKHNCAFWDSNRDKEETHCVFVKGCFGDLETAKYIPNKKIEETVKAWVEELADWCHDDCDEDEDDKRFAHKELRVEIQDNCSNGGLDVFCFNKDDERDHEFHLLPVE